MGKSGDHYSIFQAVFSMNAVGIDVSKGKSTVAIFRPMGEVVQYDMVSLERLVYQILSLGEETRVVMEAT